MQHYNNPDTNVFYWRKRIRQMTWSEFGGADPDRVCSDQRQRAAACCSADEMRWCEAALREWKREDVVQLNHSHCFQMTDMIC